jgi:pyruvate-formate lyase-activating enzyme
VNFTNYLSALARVVLRRKLVIEARLRNKAFFCNALAGNSQIGIAINSDRTVSCTNHDVDGSGRIGDLKRESLVEILGGEAARRFRAQLAAGYLPTPLCARCGDLRMVPKEQAADAAREYRLPQFVMLENTSACNLRCRSCPRSAIRRIRSKVSMSPAEIEEVAWQLKAAGVRQIAYLNQGDPFLSARIRQELEIIRRAVPGVRINTSTNGMLLDSDEKREAALLIDDMQFSVDGISQRMVNKYQRGMDFDRARRNLKALVEYRDRRGAKRPFVTWKYLLFCWNDRRRYLRRAIEMAREAGADRILFEPTWSPLYAVSLRYRLGLLAGIGQPCDDGFEVVFRPVPKEDSPLAGELQAAGGPMQP